MMFTIQDIAILLFAISCFGVEVKGHGKLWEPAGRETAWRVGFQTRRNYDDNGMNCGGLSNQEANNGRCGYCGSAYRRQNGRTRGTIVRTYRTGQVIDVDVQITAQHLGFLEFEICNLQGATERELTMYCRGNNITPLYLTNGDRRHCGDSGYGIDASKNYAFQLTLPSSFSCPRGCVLRWRYHGGNNGGKVNGCAISTAAQEEFYNCADIKIDPSVTAVSTSYNTMPPRCQCTYPEAVYGRPRGNQRPPPNQSPAGSSNPGTAGSSNPGVAGSSNPGTAGSTNPGTAGSSNPGTAGSTNPGTAGSSNPGTAGSSNPGAANSSNPGTAGSTNPGAAGSSNPGPAGSSNQGSAPNQRPDPVPVPTPAPGQSQNPGRGPAQGSGQSCQPTATYAAVRGMVGWCNRCSPNCPRSHCRCCDTPPCQSSPQSTNCEATGPWTGSTAMTDWCQTNCAASPPNCPASHCSSGCRS